VEIYSAVIWHCPLGDHLAQSLPMQKVSSFLDSVYEIQHHFLPVFSGKFPRQLYGIITLLIMQIYNQSRPTIFIQPHLIYLFAFSCCLQWCYCF